MSGSLVGRLAALERRTEQERFHLAAVYDHAGTLVWGEPAKAGEVRQTFTLRIDHPASGLDDWPEPPPD
jgi:hypothetical protein